ncbi:MAG: alpha/beta fold hydrolase, partial [Acidobacteriota bacterium]
LASNHKVILFDQRGTGLSSGPVDSESITMENFIQDIEGIRTAFGIEKMNLFGHSWGGMLAMHYALRYPENLKSLILASTAASFSSFGDMRKAIVEARSPADSAALREIADSEAFQQRDAETVERFWRIYFKVYFADPTLALDLDLAFTENTLRYSDAVASLILQSAGEFDLHEALTTLTVPTLVLHGDADPMPLAYAERIHQSIPDSRLVVLERSGHWVFVDAIDQITTAVEEFLSDLS